MGFMPDQGPGPNFRSFVKSQARRSASDQGARFRGGGLGRVWPKTPNFDLHGSLNLFQVGALWPIPIPGSSPDLAGYRGEVGNG
jgi:hypothetical protein